jgi:Mrp family chromosome partitioning ATPase/capsular polysaccharide biosynthesis protein
MNSALSDYAVVLRRWWRIVAALSLGFLTIAAVYLIAVPAPYRSTAVLFVSTPRDDAQTAYQGDTYAKDRILSYSALGKSTEIAQRVINDVGLDIDPQTLANGTKLAPVFGTTLLQLTTKGNTPQQAQAIGNAYVEELRRRIGVLESVSGALTPRADLTLVQPPTFGRRARQFPSWMILGAAGWSGLLIGAFAAAVVSLLDGRIRRPEDASEATGTPVLARFASSVPWEQPEVQPWAGESGRELRSPLDRLAILGSKVILVASAERGAGKTGVALTVARALADRDSSVALVDFDSRGSRLASVLGLSNPTTVRVLVQGHEDQHAEDSPENSQHRRPSSIVSAGELPAANWNGVGVIPFGLPEENPGSTADGRGTASLLESLRSRYDWVVIDTPAAIDFSDASRLAHHADAVVLIAKAGRTGFDELRKVSIELSRGGGHLAGVVFVDETAFPGRLHSRYRKSKVVNNVLDPSGQLADLSGST